MKVMMISRAPVVGGAELSLLECAAQLSKLPDVTRHIAAPKDSEIHDASGRKYIPSHQYTSISLEGKTGLLSRVKLPFFLIKEVCYFLNLYTKQQVDLVHINGLKAALSSITAAKLLRIPSVLHIRDYPKHPKILCLIASFADTVIVASQFLEDAVLKTTALKKDKVRIIPNGIEPSSPSSMTHKNFRKELNIESDRFLVLMIAQLTPWKRHDLLLEAISILKNQGMAVHLAITGSDLWGLNSIYEQSLHIQIQRDDLIDRVTFLGHRNDIQDLLEASDIMVLPSQNEPFGRVVLEAWNSGTPVIVSGHGGPAELVEDDKTGLHFSDGDAEALAESIKKLMYSPDLANKLSEAGKKEVQQYTVEAHASAITQCYRDTLSCK